MKDSRRKLAVTLVGIVVPIIAGIMIIGTYTMGCDSIQQTNYIGSIKGYVQDDSSKSPLIGVKVTCTELTQIYYSGDSGLFILKDLSMGTSEHYYGLVIEYPGYKSLSISAHCKVGETTSTGILYMIKDTL